MCIDCHPKDFKILSQKPSYKKVFMTRYPSKYIADVKYRKSEFANIISEWITSEDLSDEENS